MTMNVSALKSARKFLVATAFTVAALTTVLKTASKDDKNIDKVMVPVGATTAAALTGGAIVCEAKRRKVQEKKALEEESKQTGIPVEALIKLKNGTCDGMGMEMLFVSNIGAYSSPKDNKFIKNKIVHIDESLAIYDQKGWKVFKEEDRKELNATRDQILSYIEKEEQIPEELLEQYDDILNERRLYPYIFYTQSLL